MGKVSGLRVSGLRVPTPPAGLGGGWQCSPSEGWAMALLGGVGGPALSPHTPTSSQSFHPKPPSGGTPKPPGSTPQEPTGHLVLEEGRGHPGMGRGVRNNLIK